jgi:DNA adenine methylase
LNYLGGKHSIAPQLVEYMAPFISKATAYYEPFIGGANVFHLVRHPIKYGGDTHPALITMWAAVRDGWIPPTTITEKEYDTLRAAKDSANPLTAFAGFGASFGGKYFGGYARPHPRQQNKAGASAKAIERQRPGIKGAILRCCSFDAWQVIPGAVVYCVPPYEGKTGYGGAFNHTWFWQWCRGLEIQGTTVFISEYKAPPDFNAVLTIEKARHVRGDTTHAIEKLYRWKGYEIANR